MSKEELTNRDSNVCPKVSGIVLYHNANIAQQTGDSNDNCIICVLETKSWNMECRNILSLTNSKSCVCVSLSEMFAFECAVQEFFHLMALLLGATALHVLLFCLHSCMTSVSLHFTLLLSLNAIHFTSYCLSSFSFVTFLVLFST